jgi:hypothetical protein
MMPCEDGVRQVVETFFTSSTLITLAGWLFVIEPPFDHSLGITKGTLSSFWPAQLAHRIVTLGIIYQVLDVYLHLLDSYGGLEKVGA